MKFAELTDHLTGETHHIAVSAIVSLKHDEGEGYSVVKTISGDFIVEETIDEIKEAMHDPSPAGML
tara:strand:+ start:835 stop:1032 length:198 start_codon:yes stop_codon:yes gene_type:complete